jgi:6-pyruvoyltetrahydropterin/6-carboxytetrahydropterin synthase
MVTRKSRKATQPTTVIYKAFTFDAAHKLTGIPSDHKCSQLHGHTYTLIVYLSGPVDARGFIMDYAEIAEAVKSVLVQIDHKYLNDIYGLDNPTTEVLAKWLWDRLKVAMSCLSRVEVKESSTTGCMYWE